MSIRVGVEGKRGEERRRGREGEGRGGEGEGRGGRDEGRGSGEEGGSAIVITQ